MVPLGDALGSIKNIPFSRHYRLSFTLTVIEVIWRYSPMKAKSNSSYIKWNETEYQDQKLLPSIILMKISGSIFRKNLCIIFVKKNVHQNFFHILGEYANSFNYIYSVVFCKFFQHFYYMKTSLAINYYF